MNKEEFKSLFSEWIVQCYIYDYTELVPLRPEQLEKFEISSLIPEFIKSFISGDWKRITRGSGASIDEMFLFSQMLFKQTVVFMFNKNQSPPPTPPEMAKYYAIPEEVIFPIFLAFITENYLTALITDGTDYHVLNPFKYEESRNVIQYEDNIGVSGDCFLTKGRNALKIDSKFIGHDKYRNWCWETPVEDFQKVFYGVKLLSQQATLWNRIAMNLYADKLKKVSIDKYNKL